jgi:hypothetical protein
MNVLHNIERLRVLADEIDALESTMLDHERAAIDLAGSEEDCERAGDKAAAARMLLAAKLAEHFVLSRNIMTALYPSEQRRAA